MRTIRQLVIGLLIYVLGFPLAVSASAKSVEIKSENFVLIGSVRESDGKELLLELEQYRQAILQLLGVQSAIPEIMPVRIYTVSGEKELKLLTGRTDIGGVYTTTIEGPVFILNSKNGFRRGKQARHIALHEYTHHLLATYSSKVYPRWYNEGLANYFSTFEVDKKGQFIIGRVYQPYGYALNQKKWMPTSVVVNSITSYPYKSTGRSKRGLSAPDFFYAQSWLAVHYIQSVPGESAKLSAYIKLLNKSRDNSGAFETAFGRTPEEFEELLKAYVKRNKFRAVSILPKTAIKDYLFTVAPLSKGQADFHRAEAMRFFSSSFVKTEQIVKQYDKAAEKIGETAHILSARADLASWESEYGQAQKYMDAALSMEPENASIQRMAGMVLLYKNEAADSPNNAEIKKARSYLMKAMLQNPDDVPAHYYYAKTYAISRAKPSAQAIASALTALDYYRAINFVESNLAMAGILLNGHKYQDATLVIDKALIWSRSRGARMSARTMKAYIKRQN